jgi:hypothetical protein
MSGANGQPWDFIVVKDQVTKNALFRVYIEENNDFIYWMEQQRDFRLRHPSFQMTHDEALQRHRTGVGWSIAPVLIVILGDGRRQWATVQGAHTFGRDQSHLTDGLANTSMMMHLAAAVRDRADAAGGDASAVGRRGIAAGERLREDLAGAASVVSRRGILPCAGRRIVDAGGRPGIRAGDVRRRVRADELGRCRRSRQQHRGRGAESRRPCAFGATAARAQDAI